MKIEDLVQGTSANEWVEALSRRATPQPQITRLRQQYDPRGHRIFDISERPDKAVRGTDGQIERFEKVARIALPLQRVIVERAVAFLFGHPVQVTCATDSDGQAGAFEAVRRTLTDNKIDSLNRRLARTILWETEAAELWYPVPENGFWARVGRNERFSFVGQTPSQYKLRVSLLSPSQGDGLFPPVRPLRRHDGVFPAVCHGGNRGGERVFRDLHGPGDRAFRASGEGFMDAGGAQGKHPGKDPGGVRPAGKERVGRCAAPDRAFGKTVVQFCRYERLPRFAQDLRDGRDPRVCPQGGRPGRSSKARPIRRRSTFRGNRLRSPSGWRSVPCSA